MLFLRGSGLVSPATAVELVSLHAHALCGTLGAILQSMGDGPVVSVHSREE